jgi:hypothetical protein
MMGLLRCPLVCIAALTVYLVVNVGLVALHHHPVAGTRPGEVPAAPDTDLQFQTCNTADGDGEEDCLLCSVLHLARTLPTPCYVEAVTAVTGKAFPTSAITRLYPLETAAQPRAPPVA